MCATLPSREFMQRRHIMSERTNQIAFYAKSEDGTVEELILDLFERDYEYNGNLDERDLWERHGGRGREFQIEFDGFLKLCDTVEKTFRHGSFYTAPKSYEVRQDVTFVASVSGGREVALSKVCVVDEDSEAVNYLFVPDLVYREEINYTFLTEAEFDCLTSKYYEYTFDGTMKEDYAQTKGV